MVGKCKFQLHRVSKLWKTDNNTIVYAWNSMSK